MDQLASAGWGRSPEKSAMEPVVVVHTSGICWRNQQWSSSQGSGWELMKAGTRVGRLQIFCTEGSVEERKRSVWEARRHHPACASVWAPSGLN